MKATTRHLAEALALSAICATLTPAVADEGRIPVFKATTINAPGSYVLTRDIALDSGSQLVIAASGVDLDLNGHSISCPAADCGAMVSVSSFDIVIRNGGITRGNVAIALSSSSRLKLDHVRIASCHYGIVGGEYVEVVDSTLSTLFTAVNGATHGRFVGNTFGTGDLAVVGTSNALFEQNVFNCSNSSGLSILDGNAVSNNAFHDCGTAINVRDGNTVENNVIRTALIGLIARHKNRLARNLIQVEDPIHLVGNDNVVADNALWGTTASGVAVQGSFNILERNTSERNPGYGIEFVAGTGNLFRNNTLRNNQLGSVGGLVGSQTNGGGNVP